MSNPLKMVDNAAGTATAGNTAVKVRVKPTSGVTPAQSAANAKFSALVRLYKALSWTDKLSWGVAATTLNTAKGRVGRHKMTASNAFVTLNSALYAVNFEINNTAPSPLLDATPLLGVRVNAVSGISGFSVSLLSSSYPDAVAILAAPPVQAGMSKISDGAFKPIGSLDNLSSGSGSNDITALYTAAYGPVAPGGLISLRLIGTSTSGLKATPLVVAGVVVAA